MIRGIGTAVVFIAFIGVVLWAVTWLWNRSVRGSSTRFRHPEELS